MCEKMPKESDENNSDPKKKVAECNEGSNYVMKREEIVLFRPFLECFAKSIA
jgi:hypothetical protein